MTAMYSSLMVHGRFLKFCKTIFVASSISTFISLSRRTGSASSNICRGEARVSFHHLDVVISQYTRRPHYQTILYHVALIVNRTKLMFSIPISISISISIARITKCTTDANCCQKTATINRPHTSSCPYSSALHEDKWQENLTIS